MRYMPDHEEEVFTTPVHVKPRVRLPIRKARSQAFREDDQAGVYLLNQKVFIFWEEAGFMYVKTRTGVRVYEPGVDFNDEDLPAEVKAAQELALIPRSVAVRLLSEGVPKNGLSKEQTDALKPVAAYLRS